MFERLGSITFRYRFVILVLWIAAAAGSVLFAPSLAKEGMTDQSKFLPATAPAVQARQALEAAFPGSTSTSSATLSFSRRGGLTEADRAYIDELATWLTGAGAPAVIRDAVTEVATPENRPELEAMLRSDDGELDIMAVNLDVATASGGAEAVVSAMRAKLAEDGPAHPGLAAHVTGAAAISSDYLAAIVKDTDSTTAVTVVLVIVILLLIYRAPLAAMVPLITIGAAFLVARGVLGVLAAAGWQISSLLDTFIVVLVFGVGTDYAIFLISRYREEIAHDNWHHAVRTTVRRIGAVITASAATVVVGLGSMAFADFGMLQTMGPALAIAIVVTLVAGLTLTPALLSIFGHYLFWPLHKGRAMGDPGGFFARLAGAVSRRPGLVTAVLLVALAIPASYVGSMQTNFDVLAELPSTSDARAGFDEIAAHLGKGKVVQATGIVDAGPGTDLLAPASLARLRDMSQDLVKTDGVATVTSLVSPEGDGVVPDGMRPSKQLAEMADAFAEDDTGSGTAGSEALLDDDVTDGLDTAREYLGLLGTAFPDVSVTTAYRTAADRLDTARDDVDQVRESAGVATQLRTLSRSMTSPAAAAGGDDADTGIIADYLDELAAAYPQVRGLDAYGDATRAAASLERKATIAAALDLSSAFSSLATWFDDNLPDATLFPDSLSGTAEAKERRAEVEATFDALPGDFTALAAAFADRPDDVFLPVGLSGETGEDLRDAVDAFVSGDRTATRFYVTTSDDPYALRAFDGIRRAQDAVAAHASDFGSSATGHLGGATADFADVQAVIGRDFERVGVITVVGILIVLMILLRAVVAPLYLVATVLLSCATALGLSAWFFQEVQGDAGVSFYLPLLVFVLLVALGSDYNIFLMSRVREESEHRPIREGIRVASGRTGAVITSAGLILAGTFGSMATAELAVLFQVGVAVAVGVLIDTFVVRSILVPAITTLAGDRAWWPFGRKGTTGPVAWPVVVTVPEAGGASEAVPVTRSRRRLAVAVGMLVLVPVTIAGLAVWSLADPAGNLDRVTAAIVNEDEGATVTSSGGTEQRLALGADLTAGLVAGAGSDTFTWVEAGSAAEASDGLADGRFGAVLTIPSDFSRTVAAIRAGAGGGEAAAAARRAALRLETDDATSYLLGSIGRSISDTIALSAAEQVTAAYVDDVLLSVTDARGRVTGSAADARGLATGSTDLAAGAGTVSSVAGELVAGLEEMASGTSDASDGFDRLAAGIDQLAVGTRKVATGASKMSDGVAKLATGADGLATGAGALAGGLDSLAAQAAPLPGATRQLADAAAGVSTGIDLTAEGAGGLAAMLGGLTAATADLPGLATSLDGLATDVAGRTGAVAGHAADRASEAETVAAGAAALAADCAGLGGPAELCTRLAALTGDVNGLAGRTGDLAVEAGAAAGSAAALPNLTGPFAAQAPELASRTTQAAGIAGQLAGGLTQPPAPGIPSIQETAGLVESGTTTLAQQMPLLVDWISALAAGATDLSDGLDAYSGGASAAATGAAALASGAGLTADGAARIAGGTSEAVGGAAELAGVVDDAVDAGRLVEAEADALAEDGRSIADDADGLAAALEDGAAAMPAWSAADRETIGGVVANPVTVEPIRRNAIATGSGLAPLFMAIALWVGALATYLVLPPLLATGRRPRRWSGALGGFLAGVAIGVAQAVLMVAVLALGAGTEIARLPELFAFAILVAVTAAAVVQALVALLGMRGWLLALVFVALQVAASGGWLPVETSPAFFGVLHPLLPMTYAVEGFRTLVAGGGASLVPAVAVHLLWLGGALAATVAVAAWRGRGETQEVMPAAA